MGIILPEKKLNGSPWAGRAAAGLQVVGVVKAGTFRIRLQSAIPRPTESICVMAEAI